VTGDAVQMNGDTVQMTGDTVQAGAVVVLDKWRVLAWWTVLLSKHLI
jgi:hypothetical protein